MTEVRFTRDELLALFAAVDELLPEGDPLRVPVGGAVAIMAVQPGRVSSDVDVFLPTLPPDLRQAVTAVTERHRLPEGWFNTTAGEMGLPPFELDDEPFFEGNRLVVEVVDPTSKLLLKLNAARAKDREDILVLMEATGFTSQDDLLLLIDAHFDEYPGSSLDRLWMQGVAREAALEFRRRAWNIEGPDDTGGAAPSPVDEEELLRQWGLEVDSPPDGPQPDR